MCVVKWSDGVQKVSEAEVVVIIETSHTDTHMGNTWCYITLRFCTYLYYISLLFLFDRGRCDSQILDIRDNLKFSVHMSFFLTMCFDVPMFPIFFF